MPQQRPGTLLKIPQIIRWRVAGISDKKIAELLSLTPQAIHVIVSSTEYQEEEEAYLNAHVSAMDEALAGKIDLIRQQHRVAVPAALRCLVDAVTQRRDLKTALAAAKEILDRDPDRTLVVQATAEDERPEAGLPEEVLTQAAVESNEIAKALNSTSKEKLN